MKFAGRDRARIKFTQSTVERKKRRTPHSGYWWWLLAAREDETEERDKRLTKFEKLNE